VAGVELQQVTKLFPGGVKAVDGASLTVAEGEFLTLLGPSGCGKTTTLRMIAGFERPDAGRVLIGGQDVTDTPPYERNTGMVFQSLALFPHMTVLDNVIYGLRMRGVPRDDAVRRGEEMLALVRLEGYGRRKPHQLSGGQRQRVAFARALAISPAIFLLDEPFSALDAKLRDDLQVELRRLQQRLKITTVFVTHNQREAMTLSDRVAVMKDGRIEQVGTPRDIYENPVSMFVASFIGQTNFFPGRIEGRDDGAVAVRTDEGHLLKVAPPVREEDGAAVAPGNTVTVSVRPESLRLQAGGPEAEGGEGVPVTVDLIRFVGDLVEYHAYTSGGREVVCTYQRGQLLPPVQEGEAARAVFPPGEGRLLFR